MQVGFYFGTLLPCGLQCAETGGPVVRPPIAWQLQSGHVHSFVAWGIALTFCPSCLRLQLGYALFTPQLPPCPFQLPPQWLLFWPDNSATCSLPVLPTFHRAPSPLWVLTQRISTPLQADAWVRALADHPQPGWVHALLRGMRSGFRISLQTSAQCRSDARPRPSAQGHSQVVGEFLRHQVAAGYMMDPFDPQKCSGVVTSSIGVVPKSTPGKFRVIVDLSRPEGASVNDQLHRELTHVAYSSIEDASLAMHALGQGAQLAKIDIRDAYRIIPVHPEERPFLALSWEGRVYIDCQLPFGLASAPAIFSAVAERIIMNTITC